MEAKIWNFAEEKPVSKTPYEYLIKYAERLEEDTNGLIEGMVTEAASDKDVHMTLALYLVVPQLRNYRYRLIEVIQSNAFTPYPVQMKLFGKAAGNVVEEKDVYEDAFEGKLKEFVGHPLTKLALTQLKTHIEIKNQYSIE